MTNAVDTRPFPALTPAQRYHFDVYGYVVIENTLTAEETAALLDALQHLKREFEATGDPTGATVRGCRVSSYTPTNIHFAHVLETDPAISDHVTHPRLVGMAEEIVGGVVRLSESEAIINSRDPETYSDPEPSFGFHFGTRPPTAPTPATAVPQQFRKDPDQPHRSGPRRRRYRCDRRQSQDRSALRRDRRVRLRRPVAHPPGRRPGGLDPALPRVPHPRHGPDTERPRARYHHHRLHAAHVQGRLRPGAEPRLPRKQPQHVKDYLVGKQQWSWRPRFRTLSEPEG